MEIAKHIAPRDDIPLINKFNIFFESDIFDLHVVLYYINEHQLKIRIRRLDSDAGWSSKFVLKIFEMIYNNSTK